MCEKYYTLSTIEAGLKLKAVKPLMLKRVNVDTTVQEKEVRFPILAYTTYYFYWKSF